MITVTNFTSSKLHWNYFLALEQDLEKTTRYIEFCDANLKVFSIELAHLLFAAASEVDVLAKSICKIIKPRASSNNINNYRSIIISSEARFPAPNIAAIEISIPRHGMRFRPWENWDDDKNPDWWHGYNHVKHERNQYFHEATLQNALNAMGALFILNYYYCWLIYTKNRDDYFRSNPDSRILATRQLQPESILLRLPEDFYKNAFQKMAENMIY